MKRRYDPYIIRRNSGNYECVSYPNEVEGMTPFMSIPSAVGLFILEKIGFYDHLTEHQTKYLPNKEAIRIDDHPWPEADGLSCPWTLYFRVRGQIKVYVYQHDWATYLYIHLPSERE